MSLIVEVNKQDNICMIKLSGILDISSVGLFKPQELQLEDIDSLLIDFSGMEFIDSTGLGAILDILFLSEDKRFSVRFAGLNDDLNEIFETVGVFTILETLQGREG